MSHRNDIFHLELTRQQLEAVERILGRFNAQNDFDPNSVEMARIKAQRCLLAGPGSSQT